MIVLDTHALVWWVAEPRRLTTAAKRLLKSEAGKGGVAASAISLFEIATLVRRARLQFTMDAHNWLAALRALPELTIAPVSIEIAWKAGTFEATLPGDPADRIIVATAVALDAALITADDALRAAAPVATVW